MGNVSPVVYDAVTKEHKPLAAGDKVVPGAIAVDPTQGNLLKNDTDRGLGVFANDAVSGKEGNALSVDEAGKLYVPKPDVPPVPGDPTVVSKDAGNYIRPGTDSGAFLDGNDVLSNGGMNLLHIDGVDKKVALSKEDLTNAGFVTDKEVDDAIDEALEPINNSVNKLDNRVSVIEEDVKELQKDIGDVTVVSSDSGNVISKGTDNGAMLTARAIVDVVEEAGITKIDVTKLIGPGDPLLYPVDSNTLGSKFDFYYNPITGRFDATGAYDRIIATTTIPSAVSSLENVTVEKDPAGQPAGTYLHFKFRLTDGTTTELYVNVNELANYYTAGPGIIITPDGEVKIDEPWMREAMGKAIEDGFVNVVSKDANNLVKKGSDGGAFVDATEIVVGPSTDEGNALTVGSDNKLYMPLDLGEL